MAKGRMGKIPMAVKRKIWRLYALGRTYREIQSELERGRGGIHVAIGSIANVVAEGRKIEPDLDQIRELFLHLKNVRGDVYSALRGCAVLNALQESGFVAEPLSPIRPMTPSIS